MSEQNGYSGRSGYQVSPDVFVLAARPGAAYPIRCEEWANLKKKIQKITSEPWFFHTIGSVLSGAFVTTLIGIFLGTWEKPEQHQSLAHAWAVVVVTGILAGMGLFFAHQQRSLQRERAKDVIDQMELIENRY